MTQELILGVLLVGILGLIWALMCAILVDDQQAHDKRQGEAMASPVESRRA
jgi:Co/Zn/Cd efflux system component